MLKRIIKRKITSQGFKIMTSLTSNVITQIILIRQLLGIEHRFHHRIIDIQFPIFGFIVKILQHFTDMSVDIKNKYYCYKYIQTALFLWRKTNVSKSQKDEAHISCLQK